MTAKALPFVSPLLLHTRSHSLTHSLSHTQPQSGRVTNTVEVRKAVFTQ